MGRVATTGSPSVCPEWADARIDSEFASTIERLVADPKNDRHYSPLIALKDQKSCLFAIYYELNMFVQGAIIGQRRLIRGRSHSQFVISGDS
jgi:hypothetical protein